MSNVWREFRIRLVPGILFVVTIGTAAWLWQHSSSRTFVGSVEATRALVSSPFPGTIQFLNVTPYQQVQKGDPIAVVMPNDPRAQLDLLRSRVQMASSRLEPSIAQRNAVDYERLRLELLQARLELATDKVNLEQAENELVRNEKLFREKLVSEDVYELMLRNRNVLRVEVEEKEKLIAELEQGLERLRLIGDLSQGDTNSVTLEAIDGLEAQLALAATNWGPMTLTAPITGMISYIHRGEGENVTDGEPLVTIQAMKAERIVGYLRQPFPFEPEIGMKVEVRTRSRSPQTVVAEIRQVGAHLEPITNGLALVRPGILVDMGLPVVMDLPAGFVVRPGELVDLALQPDKAAPVLSATGR